MYKGRVSELLVAAEVEIGDTIKISKNGHTHEGVLIPRSEIYDDKHIVIKMRSGYNIGISVNEETSITKIGEGLKPTFSKPTSPEQKRGLPKVTVLSTGGTIASRVDYRTGGVRPALSANELYSIVPELSEVANISTEVVFSLLSEDITPNHWTKIAEYVTRRVEEGVNGVIIAHGTDTMGYTAAALSFALQNLPIPVILVGSQRSSDRPSSDAPSNLVGAVSAAAHAPFAEVAVAMHETVDDDGVIFHRGTKVRKCHTSRRDAFESVNANPIALFKNGQINMLTEHYQKRDKRSRLTTKAEFNEDVALVKFHPGFRTEALSWYINKGFRGLVLQGTGLGHVGSDCIGPLKRAIDKGIIVGMTSQCIWGRINMNVYRTGRELLKIGVIPLGDMLSETGLVKVMWALGQTKDPTEVKTLLLKNVANEFSDRSVFAKH